MTDTIKKLKEVREALAFVRHRDSQWHDDAVVTPAIATLNAVIAEMGWQPIETAPKDGTDVLIWKDMGDTPVVHIAWYRSKEEWEDSGKYCGFCETIEEWEGWWSYTENSVSQSKLDGHHAPTHWMPLPAAPGSEKRLLGEG